MSAYIFTRKILAGEAIDVFDMGRHSRDFTYIDDVVKGVVLTLDRPATASKTWSSHQPDPASSDAPWRIYNIGNGAPVPLLDFIALIERACGRKADKILLPKQLGDVEATSADVTALQRDVGFRPDTAIGVGIEKFVAWYRDYHKV